MVFLLTVAHLLADCPRDPGRVPLTGKAIADNDLLSVKENIGWNSNLHQGQAIATCGGLRVFDWARFKAEDYGERSLRLLPAGPGDIPGNSGKPAPFDPVTLFESGEITIDRLFRICMQGGVEGRDLDVLALPSKLSRRRRRSRTEVCFVMR